MINTQEQLKWEAKSEQKFKLMIQKLPLFHREIARQVVERKAQQNAIDRGSQLVEESDIVQAFLSEVPLAFYSLMIRVLQDVGFDYRKYEGK